MQSHALFLAILAPSVAQAFQFDPCALNPASCAPATAFERCAAGTPLNWWESYQCPHIIDAELQRVADEGLADGTVVASGHVRDDDGDGDVERVEAWLSDEVRATSSGWDTSFIYGYHDTIHSCDEYVFQRFWTVQDFLFDASEDPVDAGQRAFAVGGIGRELARFGGSVRSLTGDTFVGDRPAAPPSYPSTQDGWSFYAPKSVFFDLNEDEIAMVRAYAHPRAQDLDSGRTGMRVDMFTGGWELHEDAYTALQGVDREMQLYHRQQRRAFGDLITQRRELIERTRSVSPTFDPIDPDYRDDLEEHLFHCGHVAGGMHSGGGGCADTRNQLRVIDRLESEIDPGILDALDAASANGCLDNGGANGGGTFGICDWAPEDFIADLSSASAHKIEAEYQRCVEANVPFSSLAWGYDYLDAQGVDRRQSGNQRDSALEVDRYIERKAAEIAYYAEQFMDLDPDDRPKLRYVYDGADRWGGDSWNAGYSYHASVGLSDLPAVDGLCDLNPHLEAQLTAYGTAMGRRVDVIDAEVNFNARYERAIVDLEVPGLGDLVELGWESDGTQARQRLAWNLSVEDRAFETSEDLLRFDKTFVVWYIPITTSVGATANLGMDYGADIGIGEVAGAGDCTELRFDVSGNVRPYANADAFAQGGVGIPYLSGGIDTRVKLVEVAVPTEASFSAAAPPDVRTVELASDVGMSLEVRSLDGSVGGYVETPWDTYRTSFFNWDGFGTEYELFHAGHTLEWEVWDGVCGIFDCVM